MIGWSLRNWPRRHFFESDESMHMDDRIFDFAYNMAFHDATMRNAFLKCDDKDSDFRTVAMPFSWGVNLSQT